MLFCGVCQVDYHFCDGQARSFKLTTNLTLQTLYLPTTQNPATGENLGVASDLD